MKHRIPPPVIGLASAGLMWGVAQALPGVRLHFEGQTLLAALLVVVGLCFDVWALRQFFKRRTTFNPLNPHKASTLVVDGLYRISRNPMYLGLLLILCGIALWLGSPLNLLILALFVWVLNELQIKPEEEAMAKLFGEQWQQYRARVRRWI